MGVLENDMGFSMHYGKIGNKNLSKAPSISGDAAFCNIWSANKKFHPGSFKPYSV